MRHILPLLMLGFFSGLFAQTSWYVDAGASAGDGSIDTPFSAIQDGIDAASDGDFVIVQPGFYSENIDFSGKNISVQNSNLAEECIIDGGMLGSVVRFSNGENAALLRGFTLQNGMALYGGGIFIDEASPELRDLHVRENITDGQWRSGGGIYCVNAEARFFNLLIEENWSKSGGGIYFRNASGVVQNVELFGNIADVNGGAVYAYSSSTVEFQNCVFYGNHADYNGAAAYCHSYSDLQFLNCSIADNTGESAFWVFNDSDPIFQNCILSNNGNDTLIFSGGNQNSAHFAWCLLPEAWLSLPEVSSEGEHQFADPQFLDVENWYFQLQSGSPAIDAGNPLFEFEDLCIPPSSGGIRNDLGAFGGPLACEWEGLPGEYGCTDSEACNYDPLALYDDGSCELFDCLGECGGAAVLDNCGVCDDDPSNDCPLDCNDEWGGDAEIDDCGECTGGSTGQEFNFAMDCAGICYGEAQILEYFFDEDGNGLGSGEAVEFCDSNVPPDYVLVNAELSLTPMEVIPGAEIEQLINFRTELPVSGLQFSFRDQPDLLECSDVQVLGDFLNSATVSDHDGICELLVFDMQGGSYLNPEIAAILEIQSQVDADILPGAVIELEVLELLLSDGEGNLLPGAALNSNFQVIGSLGDSNSDSIVDVLDLVQLVALILDEFEPSLYQSWAGDLNEDGVMNIQDVIHLVNLILG